MPPSFGEPSQAAQNLLYAMSGIKWPKLRWQVTETGQAQFLELSHQVAALRAELLQTMERVRHSGASGATITAWFSAMAVMVGDDEVKGALPELEELLDGTSEFIGTLGEEAKHLETMLLVIVMALLMELLHLLWESIFNPIGAAVQWAALMVAGRNLVIAAVVEFVQKMFQVLKPFIVGQSVSILFQVGVEFFTQLLNGHWDLDKLGEGGCGRCRGGSADAVGVDGSRDAHSQVAADGRRARRRRGHGARARRGVHRGDPGGGRLGRRIGDHRVPTTRSMSPVGMPHRRCSSAVRNEPATPRRRSWTRCPTSPTRASWTTWTHG